MRRGLLLVLALAAAFPARPRAGARFAVVVGNNLGSSGRPRLWFAESDADRLARTLVELGDFAEDRVVLLRGGGARALREALAGAEAKVQLARTAGERPLLVFFYSGHAGAGGLELGGETVGFGELRSAMASSGAETRVAIVDACEAGLLTQVKGATAAPALDFAVSASEGARGLAFIASTAVGEQAQESAAIGGSFFTHHLEVALRGAGDADGDGLVTLAEAFHYTSAMTVSGTAVTHAGPQHPTYDFRLSGRGDVVLADLRRAGARLRLPADPGALYILRGERGVLAEVPGASKPLLLGLPAGRYGVERRSERGRATGSLSLARGDERTLPLLSPTRYELARSKGGPKPGLVYAGFGFSHVGLPGFGLAPSVRAGIRKEVGPLGLRARFEYTFKRVDDQAIAYDYSLIGGTVAALYPVNAGRVLLEAGPYLGYGYASQRLATGASRQSFASGVLMGGLAFVVTAPVGPVRLGLDGDLGLQRFKLNQENVARIAGSLAFVALYGF